MRGACFLALRYALHHRARTLVLVACVALTLFLPLATRVVASDYQRSLASRADATPLVAGARGNRFDLVLSALYFRASALPPIPWKELDELARDGLALAIPLHVRFTARGRPIVATSPEYFELRGLTPERGTLPLRIGDAVLGAKVARELELAPGDALYSDPRELYDISKPSALKLHVTGVLRASGTPDDEAVFSDVKTAWILEGIAHGHEDVSKGVDPSLVLGRKQGDVVLSEALVEASEVTDENLASFHTHGDPDELPLSSIVLVPRDAKAATILAARFDSSREWQVVEPRAVVGELLGFVFRLQRFLDAYLALLSASTALLVALVVALSLRARARELETLHRIGASPSMTLRLVACELALVLGASLALALLATLVARGFAPELVRKL